MVIWGQLLSTCDGMSATPGVPASVMDLSWANELSQLAWKCPVVLYCLSAIRPFEYFPPNTQGEEGLSQAVRDVFPHGLSGGQEKCSVFAGFSPPANFVFFWINFPFMIHHGKPWAIFSRQQATDLFRWAAAGPFWQLTLSSRECLQQFCNDTRRRPPWGKISLESF